MSRSEVRQISQSMVFLVFLFLSIETVNAHTVFHDEDGILPDPVPTHHPYWHELMKDAQEYGSPGYGKCSPMSGWCIPLHPAYANFRILKKLEERIEQMQKDILRRLDGLSSD